MMTQSQTTQYHTVKRIDNSRLLRPTPKARLNDCWRTVAVGAAMATCLLTYAWQHFECIQLRYQLEHLQTTRAQALELNQQLHVQDAALRAPGRIDTYARKHLGLTVAAPGQQSSADASDAVVAQARAAVQPPRP
jgi:cell division protein FtsL